MLENFIHLIEGLKGNPLSFPVFIGMYVVGCWISPVSLFPVAGGVLFGFRLALVVNMVSLLLGASGPFFLARRLGQKRLTRFFNRWQNRDVAAHLRNPGAWAFVVLRLVGFPPFTVTNYLAGLSHMRYRRYLWTTAIGVFPGTFILTFFADTLWKILVEAGIDGFHRAMMNHSKPLLLAGGGMAALLVTGILLNRWTNRKNVNRSVQN
ncbi:MAG: VTT domain-containing protein [Elusimicrobia bacterium]|jgi:phospholipase D1/2|nr:VTT domain-containing protein [Elusimicrobiota bacterium]